MDDSALALRIIGGGDYKSSELYQWKGFNQYALEQYESAESSFSRAIFLGSKQAATYYSLGLAQLHLKKHA
jgi:Flp pilus assembly protein TadD